MPKEVLFEIIKKGLYLSFVLIIIAHIFVNTVFLTLILRLNRVKVKLKKMLPFILVCLIYTLFGKLVFSGAIFSFIFVCLITCLVYFINKMPILKIFFISLIVMLLSIIGIIGIMQPLILYKQNFSFLIGTTPLGVVLGSLFEIVFPAIALLYLSLSKIHFQTSRPQKTFFELLGVSLFALLSFAVYYLVFLFIWMYQHNLNSPITPLLFELLLLTVAILIFFYIFKTNQQKQQKLEQILTEMEHSNRFLETVYSERRDYQNTLQVINVMATLGDTKELQNFSAQTSAKYLKTSGITKINDPIVAAAIIFNQSRAKEYGISITIHCNQPLEINPETSPKLGKIFNVFLYLLIESVLTAKGLSQTIIIDITEDPTDYSFDFKINEVPAFNKKKPPFTAVRTPDYSDNLEIVKNMHQ